MAPINRVKSLLQDGGVAFGTWIQSPSPSIANLLAMSGMDFVTVDMEHGPASFETAETILYAVEAGGATPMIRLGAGADDATILRCLDIGSQGVLVAKVQSGEEAQRIARAMRYHPDGERGLAPFTRVHGYDGADLPAKLAQANDEQLTGVLIEDEEGFANVDDIVSVDGVDLVYVGIYDLSQVMGVPGQLEHPDVVDRVRATVERIDKAGKAAGAVTRDRDHARGLLDIGFRYLSYLSETAILAAAMRDSRAWFEELRR